MTPILSAMSSDPMDDPSTLLAYAVVKWSEHQDGPPLVQALKFLQLNFAVDVLTISDGAKTNKAILASQFSKSEIPASCLNSWRELLCGKLFDFPAAPIPASADGEDNADASKKKKGGLMTPVAERLPERRTNDGYFDEYHVPANIYNWKLSSAKSLKEVAEFLAECVQEVPICWPCDPLTRHTCCTRHNVGTHRGGRSLLGGGGDHRHLCCYRRPARRCPALRLGRRRHPLSLEKKNLRPPGPPAGGSLGLDVFSDELLLRGFLDEARL